MAYEEIQLLNIRRATLSLEAYDLMWQAWILLDEDTATAIPLLEQGLLKLEESILAIEEMTALLENFCQ